MLRPMTDPRSTFGQVAGAYLEARPRYPAALFEWLVGQCFRRENAWDCATGNGQAATAIAAFFRRVDATDSNAAQIANAVPAEAGFLHRGAGGIIGPGAGNRRLDHRRSSFALVRL